jgi:hypothetical protein
MQHGKQPFRARLQLLERLTFNAGKHPATSQLDWLNSTTAMTVLFWSRATRDLLKPFGRGIVALHRLDAATKLTFPRRPPHSISRSQWCQRPLFPPPAFVFPANLGRVSRLGSGTESLKPLRSSGESASPVDIGVARQKSRAFAAFCAWVGT